MTQAPPNRALSGWVLLATRQAAITVVTFAGVVALGRLLGPGDFALYGYTTITVVLGLALGDFGMAARIIRDDDAAPLLGRALGAQLLALAGIVALTAAALPFVPSGDRGALAALVVAFALAALQTLPTALLERSQDFHALRWIEVVQRTLFVALAVVLAVTASERLAVPLAGAVAGVFGYLAAARAARWRARPAFTELRSLVGGFSSHWWQGRVITQLTYAMLPLFGGVLFGTVENSHIVLALSFTSFITLLAPLVARATFPAMSRAAEDERVGIFREVFALFFVVSVPVLAVVIVCAEEIIRLLFGAGWVPAADVLRAMCLPTLVGLTLTATLPLFYLSLDAGLVKRALVAWLVAQAIVTPLAALPLDVLAVPLTSGATAAAALIFLCARLADVTGYRILDDMAWPMLLGGVAMAAGLGVQELGEGYAVAALAGLVTVAAYGAAAWWRSPVVRDVRNVLARARG